MGNRPAPEGAPRNPEPVIKKIIIKYFSEFRAKLQSQKLQEVLNHQSHGKKVYVVYLGRETILHVDYKIKF